MTASIARILEARGAFLPRLSPDGATLFYLSDVTGTQQLWRVPAAGGTPARLSFDCDRVGDFRVSPDGRRIAYGADVNGNERWQIWVVDAMGSDARKLTERPDRMHHVSGWSSDGQSVIVRSNARDPRFFDVVTLDAGTRATPPRMLFEWDGTLNDAVPLPDGRFAVVTNRDRSDHNDVFLVDSSRPRRLTDDVDARYAAPRQAADGLLLVSNRDRDFSGVSRLGPDGGYARVVAVDHDVEAFDATDGRWAYAVNRDGGSEIHVVNGADRIVSGVPFGALGSGLDLVPDGSCAFALTRFDAPSEVFVASAAGARVAVPATLGGLSAGDLPVAEPVSWTAFDGRRIPGTLLRPQGTSGARATVVQVHGGPEGQARPLWNPTTIALIAAGFNVLQPNVRGSTGYGLAYRSLDDVRLRLDSVRDLDAAAAWLGSEGIAPPDRIAVMGGSYGGFMTLAALAFFPARWRAGVCTVGIANFVTFLERTDAWRRPLREAEYGSLERDREFLEDLSPINHLDAIAAPLMVIHGANDPRVPVHEAEQIVAALRGRERPVEYLRYEDEGHGIVKFKNRVDLIPRIVAFLQRHLK